MPLPPITAPASGLSDAERARTARHVVLPGFGEPGQRRLRAARVAVVGVGGLGSPVILALAAAGVGELVVIDDDVVEHSNLQRQVIHGLGDVGSPKVDSAVRAAAALSPETLVHPERRRLDAGSALDLLRGADVVVDGSDSFATRREVAAACEALGVPLVWGTIQGFDAQVTVFWSAPPPGAPALRLRDLYPPESTGEPPSCAQVGVLGALCLQVGGLMAVEAIKLITGLGESLLGRVLLIDSLRARQREVPLLPSLQTHQPVTASDAGSIEAADVARLPIDDDHWIVDVREADEVATGVIAGARHVPLAVFLADPAAHLPVASSRAAGAHPTVLVCEAGMRAARAAQAAGRLGVDVVVLGGGMAAWRATGLPLAADESRARTGV